MKTKSAKAKGRRLQNLVKSRILYHFPELTGAVDTAIMGESGMDIKLYSTARDTIPFAIECKNVEKWSVDKWWEQAEYHADGTTLSPLLIMTKNRRKSPLVAIDLEDFLKILRRAYVNKLN